MNISNKDINLLYLFKILYEELNLTHAAERMSLSQPALSHKLKKLRREFNDELFVRAARGLTPTPMANDLAPEVLELVTHFERFYQKTEDHNFLDKSDTVYLYATDFLEQLLLPRLLPKIYTQAPHLKIVTRNTLGRLPKKALEKGECDIAIAGFFENLPDTFYQQGLRDVDFVVLACKTNAHIKSRLTLSSYLKCPHLVTTLNGDLNGLVDQLLKQQGKERNVVAGISSFLSPPAIIHNSDFIITCLEPLARKAIEYNSDLRIYPCPLVLKPVGVTQVWHKRTHGDQLRHWLRQQIRLELE